MASEKLPHSYPTRRATVGKPSDQAPTDIDRRLCQRLVPLQVLGLGLSRTGTSSLRQALLDLGYDDCYHFASCMNENPRDCDLWCAALEAKFQGQGRPFTRTEWDQLLGHCQAVTDTPCVVFYAELLAAYPDAKVILTVRDSPEQWFTSICRTLMDTWFDVFHTPTRSLQARVYRLFIPETRLHRLSDLLHRHYMFGFMHNWGLHFYQGYNAEIQRIVPADRLLLFNVKEGWEPLCRFLGKEAPPWDFPRSNEAADFIQTLQGYHTGLAVQVKRRMRWLAGMTLGVIAAGATGWYWAY
ncbi:hypothetical protein BO94DRAFT_332000 [Aspergillus sclerotioniger CBS 115572]|uniref:NAD dependent epimerase/dehydratase n=1 Tax=Aspergillus sclerotioniger CBS 115572 TaxID=1450535 RepID=A0A317UXQ6_9EURO|nr:hypothetical protein BO94DRAFT_332000 [Aspergillus sclerotioniger CBS 115572]PWY66525.1 hypothetical protein BO94DRAFT_332000 [Aspergillus sclerotioniger CBS 115572]